VKSVVNFFYFVCLLIIQNSAKSVDKKPPLFFLFSLFLTAFSQKLRKTPLFSEKIFRGVFFWRKKEKLGCFWALLGTFLKKRAKIRENAALIFSDFYGNLGPLSQVFPAPYSAF